MAVLRVWLSGWEWACCGDPFEVGDPVSFACRAPRGDWFIEQFGTEFAGSIELVEEHHDSGDDDRPAQTVAGTVRAVHAVVVDERVVRVPRPPRPAPPERIDLGGGISMGVGPVPPYVLTSDPIPGTTRLRAMTRVPGADARDFAGAEDPAARRPDPEDGAIVSRNPGWVVDVEV